MSYFTYLELDSVVHRLDPRAKLIYVVAVTVGAMASGSVIFLVGTVVLNLFLFYLARIPLKVIYKYLTLLVPFSILIIIFQAFAFPLGKQVIFAVSLGIIGELVATVEGIYLGIKSILLFLSIMMGFWILILTTSISDFVLALVKLHLPYKYSFLLTSTFRFMPLLEKEWKTIYDAQRARALELEKGFVRRIKGLAHLLPTLFIIGIVRSEQMALSLESRALDFKKERTYGKTLRLRGADRVLVGVSVALLILALVLRVLPL
ncbi:MAG: energy-coupling factor transporter transmembrane component T [Candidatus Bathyarchaeia archaeon]|jgi:energy-coupling factor transport system permease protein